MRMRRQCFTLLEVMIALGLLAVLMTFLFGFYREITDMHHDLDKTREKNFRLLYVQHRLANVISNASFLDSKEVLIGTNLRTLFYTAPEDNPLVKGSSLVLMYNNGVEYPPCFSQNVLGRLYLDKEGSFCLVTWPSPNLWKEDGKTFDKMPVKKEILFENIKDIEFVFYVPPKLNPNQPVKETNVEVGREKLIPAPGMWHHDWDIAYQELPALVKVILKHNREANNVDVPDTVFIIPIAYFDKPIYYSR